MQRLINVFCILFFFTLSLSAQNISVASFNLDESDLTANLQGTTVFDQNGEKCALIRIQTTQTGFAFDVGSLGVSKVVQKTGEIWVYVPFGVKRMTLRHQLLGTTDYVFPMGVEKARAYRMQLTTGEVQTIVKNAVTSQYVLFVLNPANAMVEIDGQTIESIDGTATKRMPFGTYGYRVQAPRYAPEVGKITVNDPKNKHIVNVNLVPQFTKVTFNVAGNAEIWIDNQRKGIGDCTLELGYGTYLVESRKQGHRTSQQEVVISKENASQPVQLKSPTPIYGSLDINSAPANAEVWVDGKQVGTSPMFISECFIGAHEVILKKQGYKDKTLSVNVTEGQTASLMETMEEGMQTSLSNLKAKVLRNGTEDKFESDEFRNGDDLFLGFQAPKDGSLAVYLVDATRTVYCLLPYRTQSDSIYPIEANRQYVFFSSLHASESEKNVVDEYVMTTDRASEHNQIYIIYTPNLFTKAVDNGGTATLPRELSFEDFQKWLANCRKFDKDMQVVKKDIVIKK